MIILVFYIPTPVQERVMEEVNSIYLTLQSKEMFPLKKFIEI